MKLHHLLLATLLVSLSFSAHAQQPAPKFTTISVPGAVQTDVYGISNLTNIIVGSYIDPNGVRHGFEMKGSQVRNVDDPNGTDTVCTGVDSVGTIVGYYINSSGMPQAFRAGSTLDFTDIAPPGATSSWAYAISQFENVAGAFTTSSGGAIQGFLYGAGQYQIVNIPGANDTWASGISNDGYSLTSLDPSGRYHASLCRGDKCTTVDAPGATNTYAHSINVYDDVALTWQDANNNFHGALLHKAPHYKFYKFDDPNGSNTQAFGVNGKYVVGQFLPSGSSTRGSFAAQSCPPLCHP